MYKRFIITILITSLLTTFCWTVGIFVFGIDLLLFPIMIILVLIAVSGLFTIPFGVYKLLRKQTISKTLLTLIAISLGYILGYILEQPIHKWDENQRNKSGVILITEIEKFKTDNSFYPNSLDQLNTKAVNSKLPKTYQLNKFTYSFKDNNYDLDIPIPIFDRWHWDKEKKQFVYDNF